MRYFGALVCWLLMAGCAFAQPSGGGSPPAVAIAIQPTANPTGTITETLSMSDGSQIVGTSSNPVNTAQISSTEFDSPASGATVQVAQGITIEVITSSGLLTSLVVQAPASPVNGQLFRVAIASGLTITALSIQPSGGGTAFGTGATVLLGFAELFVYRASATSWVRIQ